MKRFLVAFLILLLAFPAQSAHIVFNLQDFVQDVLAVKQVKMTPTTMPDVNGSSIVTRDTKTKQTSAAGSVTFSNVVEGTYRVDVTGPTLLTTFNITVTNTSDTLNASDLISVSTNSPAGEVGYSQASADGRFLRQIIYTNGTAASTQSFLNFVYGTNMAIRTTNNATTGRTDVYISSSASGGGAGDVTGGNANQFSEDSGVLTIKSSALVTNIVSRSLTNHFGTSAGINVTNQAPVWISSTDADSHHMMWRDQFGRDIFDVRRDVANPVTNSVIYLGGQSGSFGAITLNTFWRQDEGITNEEARITLGFTDSTGGQPALFRYRPGVMEGVHEDFVGSGAIIASLTNFAGLTLGDPAWATVVRGSSITAQSNFVASANIVGHGSLSNALHATFSGAVTNRSTVTNAGAVYNGSHLTTHGAVTNNGTVRNSSPVTFADQSYFLDSAGFSSVARFTNGLLSFDSLSNASWATFSGAVTNRSTVTNAGAVYNGSHLTSHGAVTNLGIVTNAGAVYNGSHVTTHGLVTNKTATYFEGNIAGVSAAFSDTVTMEDNLNVANGILSSTNFTGLGTNNLKWLNVTNDARFLGSIEVPNGAAPTTDAFAEIAGDNNAWASGRGALQIYDGTANTYAVATLASDTPGNGQVPKWNTGGTITWEDDSAGGAGSADYSDQAHTNIIFVNASTNVLTGDPTAQSVFDQWFSWTNNAAGLEYAQFALTVSQFANSAASSRSNRVFSFGYNPMMGGTKLKSGEASATFVIETHYHPSGTPLMEMYPRFDPMNTSGDWRPWMVTYATNASSRSFVVNANTFTVMDNTSASQMTAWSSFGSSSGDGGTITHVGNITQNARNGGHPIHRMNDRGAQEIYNTAESTSYFHRVDSDETSWVFGNNSGSGHTGIRYDTSVAFKPATLQTLSAGTAITATRSKARVAGNGGAVTLTSAPTIADGIDGQIIYIQGTSDSNTVALQDQGTLASSNLQLGAASRTLGAGDILVLMFDTTDSVWYEVSFANN